MNIIPLIIISSVAYAVLAAPIIYRRTISKKTKASPYEGGFWLISLTVPVALLLDWLLDITFFGDYVGLVGYYYFLLFVPLANIKVINAIRRIVEKNTFYKLAAAHAAMSLLSALLLLTPLIQIDSNQWLPIDIFFFFFFVGVAAITMIIGTISWLSPKSKLNLLIALVLLPILVLAILLIVELLL